MTGSYRISTGIDGLDQTLDYLRPGDNVTWQIENIGDYAFTCRSLKGKLEIPDSVKVIYDSAFQYCEGFTSLKLPEGIENIVR